LRDLFAAMFFVVFGLNTDPTTIPPVLLPAIGLAVVTTATKVLTGWWAAGSQGIGVMGRARAGAALIARGEFSIVIAGLAVSAGAVEGELAALATAYVLLMAVLGPVGARVAEPIVRLFQPPRPKRRGPEGPLPHQLTCCPASSRGSRAAPATATGGAAWTWSSTRSGGSARG
ncbi:hypothetical protein GS934_18455, partial [Rhodococcus hoagii]|nr:hypothetical protein [Prescottella equi]NKZ88290.1 hypothetical protein [Prescottella equi]